MVQAARAGRLAILAGDGAAPRIAAHEARERGEEPLVLVLGGVEAPWAASFETTSLGWGEVGRLIRTLQAHGCTRICLIGGVVRPDIKSIRFDLGGLFALPRIIQAGLGGDDRILRHIISLFEEKGFSVVSPLDIAPSLALPRDLATHVRPYEGLARDLATGVAALSHLSSLDVGQALVVIREQIVAIEAAEGTDGMLARIADMRQAGRIRVKPGEGVLVKAAKLGQDLRVDLPTVGLRTLEMLHKAGLAAMAAEAERVLCPERHAMLEAATAKGIYVTSFVMQEQG